MTTTIGFLIRPGQRHLVDAALTAHPDLRPVVAEDPAGLRPALPDLTALVVNTPLYSADLAGLLHVEAPKLRWVQTLSSGVDKILGFGLPERVVLTSAVGCHGAPVADHAMALLLALFRHVPAIALAQSRREWSTGTDRRGLREVTGCRATMLGYGHIGQAITRRLQAFGAQVTAVNRSGEGPVGAPSGADRLLRVSALHEAVRGADILMICLPGEAAETPLVDGAALDLLAAGAVVINVGRGSSLDAAAVAERLLSGHLSGAALDVFAQEPLPGDDPLWTVPGLLVSPHVAGNGDGVPARLAELVTRNIGRLLSGEALLNEVRRHP